MADSAANECRTEEKGDTDKMSSAEGSPLEGSPLVGSPLEGSPCSSPDLTSNVCEEHMCRVCMEKLENPRILSCLHVFCSDCVEKLLDSSDSAESNNGQDLTPNKTNKDIVCPECKQITIVKKGIEDLQQDYVMMNMIDMVAIEEMQIICTSCKAKEKAVARCSDCANFLCPNCVTAHQYMRCFENHKVVSFDDLKKTEDGMSLHKPLFCPIHPAEGLKYYCNTCQTPICNECMVGEHKPPEHTYERLPESTNDCVYINDLKNLVQEAKDKIEVCMDATSSLDGSLRDLQMQRDDARALILETFQSYKAILEKRQHDLLEQLEEIHTEKELNIMEIFHNIEKVVEKVEDGCKFADRILKHGNGSEILCIKKLITTQLLSLINNTPKPEVNVCIKFDTDHKKFDEMITTHFGNFKLELDNQEEQSTSPHHLTVSPHSSFENEGINLPSGLLSPIPDCVLPSVSAPEFIPHLQSLSGLSLPSMSPSPTVPVNNISAGIVGVSAQTIHSIASSLQNLPTGQVERSSSRNSYSPAMSDSGISVDAASNSSGNNQPTISLASLAKLGSVSINERGQITLNGQVIQGLNVSNVSGLSAAMGGRVQTPTTPATEPTLANLLTSMSIPPGGVVGVTSQTPPPCATPTTRAQTPQLNELASLLSQTSPTLTSLANMTGSTAITGSTSSGLLSPSLDIKAAIAGIPPPSTPTFGQPPGSNIFAQGQPPFPARSTNKMSAMQIRCKFGQLGPGKSQFNSPHGFCLGMDEDIVVADTNNHRVQVFEKTGEFKYQFGIPGREEGQLWYPRKVAVIRSSGKYVVCDRGNERSRMQIFTKNGHFIKKIAIRYIDIVAGLAVTSQAGHIVAVDSVSPTVFVIAETGDLIKWFDCSDYMREPSDIAVNGKEYFVCDFKGHCVVVFNEDGQFMRRIGCENITNYPNGIDISDAGDVLVGDSHGNRFHVAVFQRDGSLIGEFECPYVKVSRCCGLKITSEGYIVTLAKNNHHVLVLNTLYIS